MSGKYLKPIKVVSVTKTLKALAIGDYTKIHFKDAKPSTITTTASRIQGRTFTASVKDRSNDTLVTRHS